MCVCNFQVINTSSFILRVAASLPLAPESVPLTGTKAALLHPEQQSTVQRTRSDRSRSGSGVHDEDTDDDEPLQPTHVDPAMQSHMKATERATDPPPVDQYPLFRPGQGLP
jgi:hypothetical protein